MITAWDFSPGDRLGHYAIIEQVGGGGFSQGYLSEHERFGKIFLKVFDQIGLDVNALLDEAFAMAYFNNHPHILKVYEARYIGDYPILAMEYVNGGTLDDRLDKVFVNCGERKLSVKDAVDIVRQITLALEDLHEEKLVHRDIKPANILLKREYGKETAKLGDFGCAVYVNDERANQVAGTLAYMAPEVIMGADHTSRSDIYSLGIVMYELLTGQPPFRIFDLAQFQSLISQGLQVEWPLGAGKFIPPEIIEICTRAVAFSWDAAAQIINTDERYQTVGQMRSDIAAFLQGEQSTIVTGRKLEEITDDYVFAEKRQKAEQFLKAFHKQGNILFGHLHEEMKKMVLSAAQHSADLGNFYIGLEHLYIVMLKRKGVLHGLLSALNKKPRELGARIVERIENFENRDPTRVCTERLLRIVGCSSEEGSKRLDEWEFLKAALREPHFVSLMLRKEGLSDEF